MEMQNRITGAILSVVAVVAVMAVSPGILAQTPAQTAAQTPAEAPPDLSGVWERIGEIDMAGPGLGRGGGLGTGGAPNFGFSLEEPPMQPWALERYRAARKGAASARDRGREAMDPILYCMPHGMPRVYTTPFPLEIAQAPGRVIMMFESLNQTRRIFTDGRKHPEGMPRSYMGHSTGQWDGDTLVVETVGLIGNDQTWLDTLGHPNTDALRIVERIRRLSHDTLEINFLFDDPKTYTKPWGGRKVFQLKPNWELMEYYICEDQFRDSLPKIRRAFQE